MGNYLSCTLSIAAGPGAHSRAAKVVFPGGVTRHFNSPTTAAELMLEAPNFFLVNVKSLHIGRRIFALNADEELEMGNVYVMFPMKRVNSFVTAADMGALLMAANSTTTKRVSGGKVRVSPESDDVVEAVVQPTTVTKKVRLNLEDIEEYSRPEFMHRMSMCRSKKPLLETIAEETICSR